MIVSHGEKEAVCQYVIINAAIERSAPEHCVKLVPVSKAGIHPSILSVQTELLSVEYLFSSGRQLN